jgi:hypothetical protein
MGDREGPGTNRRLTTISPTIRNIRQRCGDRMKKNRNMKMRNIIR